MDRMDGGGGYGRRVEYGWEWGWQIWMGGHQMGGLTLSEFEEINSLLFTLKSSENHKENHCFSDDFRGNRS